MKSNLQVSSNLFLREASVPLAEDRAFLPYVRGIAAVRKMLWKAFEIHPSDAVYNDSTVMHLRRTERITEAQWNSLKWGIACYLCDSIPVGQSFSGKVEDRCREKKCKSNCL